MAQSCSEKDGFYGSFSSNINFYGLPCGSGNKESARNAGDPGSIPGSGRSPGEERTTECSILAWEIHGHRNLAGYSTLGHKQSEMTEET